MSTNYSIFKPNVITNAKSISLNEPILITSEIEKQDILFNNRETITEEINFFINTNGYSLYQLFNELGINPSTGKPNENSRISFIQINNFPDGCFYLIDDSNKKINCYICELKHRPGDKLFKIAQQFYSGYIHCRTFFTSVELDEEYDIQFHFLIAGFIRYYDVYEKQLITHGVTKTAPGVLPAKIHELRAYHNYKMGRIYYSYVSDYKKKFEFKFDYIQLIFDCYPDSKSVKLSNSLSLIVT